MSEAETTLEQIKDPSYWRHVAKSLRIGDQIEVISIDLTFYVKLLVLAASKTDVRIVVLDEMDLEDVGVLTPEVSDFEVKWRGGARWSVLRKQDGEVMVHGLAQESDAAKWINNRVQAEAA
jgi:hypothetical protein